MHDKDDEVIIQMNTRNVDERVPPGLSRCKATVTLINGANGDRIQKFTFKRFYYIHLTTSKRSTFTVTSNSNKSDIRMTVISRQYSQQSDGLFTKSTTDAFLLPEDVSNLTIHPFLRMGFSLVYEGVYSVLKAITFAQSTDPDIIRIVNSAFEGYASRMAIDRYLCVAEMHDVTLPPEPSNDSNSSPQGRRRLILGWSQQEWLDDGSNHQGMWFSDCRQLVILYQNHVCVLGFV